jgi:nucleotidyltransferase/DNA polymerase involved in DNA repair
VVDAPSIGPIAAERLANVGIRTVADLLNANPESTAEELGEAKVTATVITRWQREARLVCRIPELRGVGAQLLVASGFHEAEQVARTKVDELVKRVGETCRSSQGQRILRNGPAPSSERIAQWVGFAAKMRPLEAA